MQVGFRGVDVQSQAQFRNAVSPFLISWSVMFRQHCVVLMLEYPSNSCNTRGSRAVRREEPGSNLRAAFATRAPERANNHLVVIERVIEVGCDSPEVNATNAGNGRLRVESSGSWKCGDHLERFFEFLSEHVGVVAICDPPCLLPPNMFLRCGCEPNAALLQCDRSSRKMASASTRRPALMSSSESFRA